MAYGRDREKKDSKYLRLTGLWESKNKRGMYSGKIRGQDIGKVIAKLEEADDQRADVVVFLWENNDKRGQKDPDYSVQIAVSEDQGRGGNNYSRGGDRDYGRSNRSGRSREDERDSSDREDERDEREEDDRDSGNDADDSEERTERPAKRERSEPKTRDDSKRKSGPVKGKKEEPKSKGKAKKGDDW